jgi:hypothetical protein
MRVVGRVTVEASAHHLAVSPTGSPCLVALSESATAIVVADVADLKHMRVLRRLPPTA